jgi:hypothetical protein
MGSSARSYEKSPIISPDLESGIQSDRSAHRPSVIRRKKGKFRPPIEARITPCSAGLAYYQSGRADLPTADKATQTLVI